MLHQFVGTVGQKHQELHASKAYPRPGYLVSVVGIGVEAGLLRRHRRRYTVLSFVLLVGCAGGVGCCRGRVVEAAAA